MKLKYKGEIIFESESLEEIEEFKNNFILEKRKFYFPILLKINKLNSQKSMVLKRNPLKTNEEYLEELKKINPEFLEEVENLGKEYFKDDSKCFFFNIPMGLFGFEQENGKIGLTEMSMKVSKEIPSEKDFEII